MKYLSNLCIIAYSPIAICFGKQHGNHAYTFDATSRFNKYKKAGLIS